MASTRKQRQVLVDQASSLTIFLDNRKPLQAFLCHVLRLYFIMSMKKKQVYVDHIVWRVLVYYRLGFISFPAVSI